MAAATSLGPVPPTVCAALDRVLSRFARVRRTGPNQWEAECPAHPDSDPSVGLSVGDECQVLLLCRADCETTSILAAVGLTLADLYEPKPAQRTRRLVATYDYRDARGELLYQVCRYEPKGFRVRHPNGGGWTWNLDGVHRVLYRLPELLAAPAGSLVHIVEGEADVDRLAALGFIATTNPGGAGKWRPEYSAHLRNQHVVILPDNDDAGRKHAGQVEAALGGTAASVRIVELPDLPPKGDVSTWLDAGGTADRLRELIDASPAAGASVDPISGPPPAEPDARTIAAKLVRLAEAAELFHTPVGEPYATIPVRGHRETHPIRSSALKGWLRREYWAMHGIPSSANALTDAVETLAARAEFGDLEEEVFLRVARVGQTVYVDLANAAWQVVEITPNGWQIVDASPVRFRRPGSMAPLPRPVHGTSLDALRPFVNLPDDDAWLLLCGALVAALRGLGPHFVLVVTGEQGSAKTTTTKIFRLLTDPSRSPVRGQPKDEQDLLISARNNWVVSFDNVSHLQPWLSDALCRLSTGGGIGKRQLYTDQDEIVLDAQRPSVLNGITEFVTRGDLLDRAIQIEQPPLSGATRRAEGEFWAAFESLRPGLLGALYDAVACALANEATVVVDRLPRMADPTRWVAAAAPALRWRPGAFERAYARNAGEGTALSLEASPLAAPLDALVERGDWSGTSQQLLAELAGLAGADLAKDRDWPKNPTALAADLKRLAPALRAAGIAWERLPRNGASRPMAVRRADGRTVTTVTGVTANRSSDDGSRAMVPANRHELGGTVTALRAADDGRDTSDGSAVATLTLDEQRRLVAQASRIFGDDLDDYAPSLV